MALRLLKQVGVISSDERSSKKHSGTLSNLLKVFRDNGTSLYGKLGGHATLHPSYRRRAALLYLPALALAFPANMELTAQSVALEYEIKAAYLYQLMKFVNRPAKSGEEEDTRVIVGVLGEDPFGKTLNQAVLGKKTNVDAAERAGLHISSRLLRLANIVKGESTNRP